MASCVEDVVEQVLRNITRYINGLADDNRNTRKRALEGIHKEILKGAVPLEASDLQKILDKLSKPFLKILSDPVEKCRQLSVDFLSECLAVVPEPYEYLPFLIPLLAQRLGQIDIIETSEELRLCLIKLLSLIVERCQKRMAPYLDDMVKILERTIVDPYPEVKKASCQCASSVAQAIPAQFHMQSESLVKPLLQSISHQHSRVRVEVIKAIGVVLQYGNGKSVEDVVSHLAQRLFDGAPTVRAAVTSVVGGWLLDLTDRYSYHARLLPLLLTSLTDDVPDIRRQASALWHDVGLKYESENENDLKDKHDFVKADPEHYPSNVERTNLGCRTLIYRHFSKIVIGAVNDLGDWVAPTRVKASQLLYTLLLHEEENVTQHLPKVLNGLYRAASDEQAIVRENVVRCAELVGYFVSVEIWCKMVLGDVKTAQTIGPVFILPAIIRSSVRPHLQPYLHDICSVITDAEVCHTTNTDVLQKLVACVDAIVTVSQEDCSHVSFYLVTVLVTVLALERSEGTRNEVHTLLERLAQVEGLSGSGALFEKHIVSMIEALQKDHDTWTQHSVERIVFDTLLLEAGCSVVCQQLDIIFPIFTTSLLPSKDPELRLKFFALLSRLIAATADASDDTKRLFADHTGAIVRQLIVPNCVWAAGRVAAAIRTTAIACLWALLDSGVLDRDSLLSVGADLLPQLRATLEDDSQSTRLLSCRCVRRMLTCAGDALCRDELHAMYPDLLKRLDDTSDDVRVAVAATFRTYVDCLASGEGYDVALYRAHLEAMHAGLLVHLDDPEPRIQQAVLEVLQRLAQIETDMLLAAINHARPKHRTTSLCDQLVDYIKALPSLSS